MVTVMVVLSFHTHAGQRGLYTTSAGLQLAYLGGAFDRKHFFSAAGSEKGSGSGSGSSETAIVG